MNNGFTQKFYIDYFYRKIIVSALITVISSGGYKILLSSPSEKENC